MRNKLKELRTLNAFAKKQSVGMQRKTDALLGTYP